MKKRKILSLFLSFCLILGLLPTAVLAADQTNDGAGICIVQGDAYDSSTGIFSIKVQAKVPTGAGIKSLGVVLTYDNTKLTLVNRNNKKDLAGTEGTKQSPKAAAINILLKSEDEYGSETSYSISDGELFRSGSRCGLYTFLYTTDTPQSVQTSGNWFDCYEVLFRVAEKPDDPANILNSDSLRIADSSKDDAVIKGVFPSNNIYSIYLTDNSNPAKLYVLNRMSGCPDTEVAGEKSLMTAPGTGTATYPGSTNSPHPASGALGGSASISGTPKYNEVLTAVTTSITGNTGTFSYQWKRNGADITSATNSTYKLVEDDIGKTITVAISSNVESGTIVSSATATVEKADGPAAPTAFTLTFTLNADGMTFTATIPAFAGGEYSFDGATYSPTTSTKIDCNPNTSCTGYARIAETPTHKASTATSSTQTSPKLTVATPTFTPNGASSFTGTQSVTISCTTVGATIHYTTDGTEPTASSPVYSTALSLTSTTTVKAIAVKTDMNNSAIATATFTKYSGGGGGGGGSYTPSYTVSVDKTENGSITVSPKSASKGDTVTITVKPDKGYELEMLKALDKDGDALKLTEKNGKYTFKMPSGKVTVKGSFVEETPVQIFKDVPVDAYYYEAVKWAAEKGITGGIGNGLFAPNQPCTRAQIVTFLWRAAGSPAPKHMSSFADVPADAFYAKAVAWAVENGITGGTGDGKFSPDATCTRAQSVTFLYRAAGSPKVSGSAEFGDVATNAYYADAVAWAAKNGITGGIGGGLFGSNNDCTRAQIVTFLYRSVK